MTPWQAALLSVLLGLGAGIAAAAEQSGTLTPESLDYYLRQAFSSPTAPGRLPLNHIGIAGESVAGGFLVAAVLDDYPAHRAGLQRGDIIVSADGAEFHPVFSFNDPALAPDGFQARRQASELVVARGDSRLGITVTPVFENLYDSYRSATLNSVQQFASGNKTIGYVRFWALSAATTDLISYRKIFAGLKGTDGIVLDLRHAAGNLSTDQLNLVYRGADNLPRISGSTIEGCRALLHRPDRPLDAESYRNPIAILIDGGTEGGAELMAYQLDKLARVITLGQTTAGRLGSYLEVQTAEGPSLRYLPGDCRTIDGQAFENHGYTPQRKVSARPGESGQLDLQFQTAFDLLMEII